jgi:hypothetical protein
VPDEDLTHIAAQAHQQPRGLLLRGASPLDLVDQGVDQDEAWRVVREEEAELPLDEGDRPFGELRRRVRRWSDQN